jgi:hypothetical protein
MQHLQLASPLGQPTTHAIPVRNSGRLPVSLRALLEDTTASFAVWPDTLLLGVGDAAPITVSYCPRQPNEASCRISLDTEPGGAVYRITAAGRPIAASSPSQPAVSTTVRVQQGPSISVSASPTAPSVSSAPPSFVGAQVPPSPSAAVTQSGPPPWSAASDSTEPTAPGNTSDCPTHPRSSSSGLHAASDNRSEPCTQSRPWSQLQHCLSRHWTQC